jgi:hypothetical protein
MALKLDAAAFQKMTDLQAQLEIVLQRANEQKLEAALAAFALARCARKIMSNYPEQTREMLIDTVIVPFLRGEPYEPEEKPPS